MEQRDFSKLIEQSQEKKLYGDWLTKYQHIERMGNVNVEGLLDGVVYVQVKIDGANLTVAHDKETDQTIIASRNRTISCGGNPDSGFNGAIEYVLNHKGLLELSRKYILRGEWLSPHTISYNKESQYQYYVFDVQRYEDLSYLTPEEYIPELTKYSINHVPVLRILSDPNLENIIGLIDGGDDYGAEQKEGVVIKRYDFVNRFGRVTWGKLISADFKEKNKVFMGATKHDPIEYKYVGLVASRENIMKVINKLKDSDTALDIRRMPEVIGRVWADGFDDYMWDFINKNRVKTFDFGLAKNLTTKATREVALAYFNGLE